MTKKRLKQIEKRIEKIKKELCEIDEMRPGSLTKQYKDPANKKGPYHQLSYTLAMKSRTEYIRKDFVIEIQRQVKNYNRYKKLTSEWITLGIEHSKLTMKLAHLKIKEK
ncbi:MAG: hypothetical protein GY834_00240 [Bacteroidetes bacterium]|nr:hypothetical protein [Bacteroidota bacterium]